MFHYLEMTKGHILELMDYNRELLAECIITEECRSDFIINRSNSKNSYVLCTGSYGAGNVFKYPMMIFKK